jgi:hypothetical protein
MVENKELREEHDVPGSKPGETYDYEYFRVKFGLSTEEVMAAIKAAKTASPVELEEYIARKYGLPEDRPDEG